MGLRPAVTHVPLIAKKLGEDVTKSFEAGTKCKAERSSMCLGEFVVWFRDRHYVMVDAKELPTTLTFTDRKSL